MATKDVIITKKFCLGPIDASTIVFADPITSTAIAIDATGDPAPIIEWLNEEKFVLTHLFLTHAHFDHVGGVGALKAAFPNLFIALHPRDVPWYDTFHVLRHLPILSLSHLPPLPPPTHFLADGAEVPIFNDRVVVRVIETPGHTPGSCCFTLSRVSRPPFALCTGDTIMNYAVGRTDLPGGSARQLCQSVHRLHNAVPPQTTFLPGHGVSGKVGEQPMLEDMHRVREAGWRGAVRAGVEVVLQGVSALVMFVVFVIVHAFIVISGKSVCKNKVEVLSAAAPPAPTLTPAAAPAAAAAADSVNNPSN